MPFTSIPSPFCASNNKSSLCHPQFVSHAITKLQQNNCVEELKQQPYWCNSLTALYCIVCIFFCFGEGLALQIVV